ncbi:hypothetical protein B0H13DRAFT_1914128 [Mycena leptocephala]|nr:hypothetical protein B0H13DRAFT_1914128 [Mycena leptocephala]
MSAFAAPAANLSRLVAFPLIVAQHRQELVEQVASAEEAHDEEKIRLFRSTTNSATVESPSNSLAAPAPCPVDPSASTVTPSPLRPRKTHVYRAEDGQVHAVPERQEARAEREGKEREGERREGRPRGGGAQAHARRWGRWGGSRRRTARRHHALVVWSFVLSFTLFFFLSLSSRCTSYLYSMTRFSNLPLDLNLSLLYYTRRERKEFTHICLNARRSGSQGVIRTSSPVVVGLRANDKLDTSAVPVLWMGNEALRAGLKLKASSVEWKWEELENKAPTELLTGVWRIFEIRVWNGQVLFNSRNSIGSELPLYSSPHLSKCRVIKPGRGFMYWSHSSRNGTVMNQIFSIFRIPQVLVNYLYKQPREGKRYRSLGADSGSGDCEDVICKKRRCTLGGRINSRTEAKQAPGTWVQTELAFF